MYGVFVLLKNKGLYNFSRIMFDFKTVHDTGKIGGPRNKTKIEIFVPH
jgi:hypothetical protein